MKKFIKKNKKMILISMTLSIFISYILSCMRAYRAIGGECLIPIITLLYWLLRYTDEEENEK